LIFSGIIACLAHVGEYIDDSVITSRVKSKFADDSRVGAMSIRVETLEGVLELSGFGNSWG